MAQVRVQLRNSANTANSVAADLSTASDIEFVVERNGVGRGAFVLKNDDPAAAVVTSGSLVRFTLAGEGRFVGRVSPREVSKVSASDEHQEAIEYECRGILGDWEDEVLQPSELQCDFVPSLDERYFNVFSGESGTGEPGWVDATEIALQGWGSTFYTGQPASWTDPEARYLWHSSGDDDDAPQGRCIFKESILVGVGKKVLDWGADNYGVLYLNGKRINDGNDFRKKQTFEFETTAGFLTIAFDVRNAEDDGPPGGNPGAVIASLREDGPEGPVIWRTTNAMQVLPYPVGPLGMRVGDIISKCIEGSEVADAWNILGLGGSDRWSVAWPIVEDISFRFYTDTLLDVLTSLAETYIDFEPGGSVSGLVLYLYNKGTAGLDRLLPLVAGYADTADDATTNITELDWSIEPPTYRTVALRWSDGWVVRGLGTPFKGVRAEQIKTQADAIVAADALLSVYGIERRRASFDYIPLEEPDDLPFVAFNVFDTLPVPSDGDLDITEEQRVTMVAVTQVVDTDEADYTITVGDPIKDEIELLEEAIKRGAPGLTATGGRLGSPTSGSPRVNAFGKATSPGIGTPGLVVASMPNVVAGASERAPCVFVGQVPVLRLYGVDSTGTSEVTVFDGVTTYTLSGTGEGLIDFVNLSGVSWDLGTMVTVTVVSKGHRSLHVLADVAEVSG